jgi:hypothetical protein
MNREKGSAIMKTRLNRRIELAVLLGLCCGVFGLWSAVPAYAHHSMAGFDRTRPVTLSGTVKQFKWANPHSWIEFEFRNAKGEMETWNIEMTAPAQLIRAGWKSNTIKAGDKATIVAYPQQSGEPGGLFSSITLADGTVLTERPAAQSAPAQPAAPPKP